MISFHFYRAHKTTINQATGPSIDTTQTSFGQVLEASTKMRTNGWRTRFQSRTIIFLTSYQKDCKVLQSSANSLSRFMTQVCFSTLIISMDLKQYKLRLETSRISTITNPKYILLIKTLQKNRFLILLQSCSQEDISKLIWLENHISNQWITSTTKL